jgi:hypothetical protein
LSGIFLGVGRKALGDELGGLISGIYQSSYGLENGGCFQDMGLFPLTILEAKGNFDTIISLRSLVNSTT